MSDHNYLRRNKKGFTKIQFSLPGELVSSGITAESYPDSTGYPIRPNGDLMFYCPSISNSPNFKKKYSEWAWQASNSRDRLKTGLEITNKKWAN